MISRADKLLNRDSFNSLLDAERFSSSFGDAKKAVQPGRSHKKSGKTIDWISNPGKRGKLNASRTTGTCTDGHKSERRVATPFTAFLASTKDLENNRRSNGKS